MLISATYTGHVLNIVGLVIDVEKCCIEFDCLKFSSNLSFVQQWEYQVMFRYKTIVIPKTTKMFENVFPSVGVSKSTWWSPRIHSRLLYVTQAYALQCLSPKAGFPLGEFVRANKQKAKMIGW